MGARTRGACSRPPTRSTPIPISGSVNIAPPRPARAPGRKAVSLHPCFVCPVTTEEYAVVRADGRGAIRTRAAGVEAIHWLHQLGCLDAVRSIMSERHESEVDLSPLVDSLIRAGMVRSVDGADLSAPGFRVRDVPRCWWRCRVDLPTRLPRLLFRLLPPALALPLAVRVRRRRVARSSHVRALGEIESRLPRAVPSEALPEIAGRHVVALARNDAIVRMVCATPTRPLGAWLERRVRLDGFEHLAAARAGGRGSIVALLHHGPFGLLLPALLVRGVALHSFNFGVEFAERPFHEIFDDHARTGGWARPRFYYSPTPANLRQYVQAIAGGSVGILMPDYHSGAGERTTYQQYRGIASRSGRGTAVPVPVGRNQMLVHAFAGWVVRRTGAAVVPCTSTESSNGYVFRFHPPLRFGPEVLQQIDDASVVRDIVAALTPAIEAEPEQWAFLLNYTRATPSETGPSPRPSVAPAA